MQFCSDNKAPGGRKRTFVLLSAMFCFVVRFSTKLWHINTALFIKMKDNYFVFHLIFSQEASSGQNFSFSTPTNYRPSCNGITPANMLDNIFFFLLLSTQKWLLHHYKRSHPSLKLAVTHQWSFITASTDCDGIALTDRPINTPQ